ncbi:uncharacterized protein LOC144558573 [Carex rostrata]
MPGKKGSYTVKEGYNTLLRDNPFAFPYDQQKIRALRAIWNWKEVIPRVQMFLWRALHDGLTTTVEMAKRFRTVQPLCPRCGYENEYTMHLLFFCPLARATWFASQIPLRVADLPLNFAVTLLTIVQNLQVNKIPTLCNLLWCLWKARNEELFSGIKSTPEMIVAKAANMQLGPIQSNPGRQRAAQTRIPIPQGARVVLIDASWDQKYGAGIGMGVYNRRGDLVYVSYAHGNTTDPFHAEAEAMWQTIKYATGGEHPGLFYIFSDCKTLVQAIIDGNTRDLPSWRAAETVGKCIRAYQRNHHSLSILHVLRVVVQTPHRLANWARKTGKNGSGTPIQCYLTHLELEQRLNPDHFSIGDTGVSGM